MASGQCSRRLARSGQRELYARAAVGSPARIVVGRFHLVRVSHEAPGPLMIVGMISSGDSSHFVPLSPIALTSTWGGISARG